MRFAFIATRRNIWAVAWLCSALDVSRSGFHAWLNRSPSAPAMTRSSFPGSTAASRAATAPMVLVACGTTCWPRGLSCGLHRIERLMRENGCGPGLGAADCRRIRASERQCRATSLDRAFEASAPNQKWIADFTYIWAAEGWLYVAAVVDLFSRRVVG